MKLSDRKKKILQFVVDDYIMSAQPVSSKSITEEHMPEISSATVRSELAQLEELGYLSQLHTSSGRIPSAEAYRLYFTELVDKGKLTAKELNYIKNSFTDQTGNLEKIVQSTVKVISELTDYTSIAYTPHDDDEKIDKINLFRYKPNQALLLIVTETTLIKDRFITIPKEMTAEQIENANKLLNRLFAGKSFEEVLHCYDQVEEEFISYKEIFLGVIGAIEDYIVNQQDSIVLAGEDKILNNPEYSDLEKVKDFMTVVKSKEKLVDILADQDQNIEISLSIGNESDNQVPEGCSLVKATYSIHGNNIGTYGVLGPLRMDYQKVITVLDGVGKILEELLKDK